MLKVAPPTRGTILRSKSNLFPFKSSSTTPNTVNFSGKEPEISENKFDNTNFDKMVTNLNNENKGVSEYGARTLNKLQKPEEPIFKFNTNGTTFGPTENLFDYLTPYEKNVFFGAILSHWSNFLALKLVHNRKEKAARKKCKKVTDIFFVVIDTPFEALVWVTNVPPLANHYSKTRILVWTVVGLNTILLVLTHSLDYRIYLQYGYLFFP
jgi:hypothetical protein